ncbi:hypothetical protein RFI_09680 [Reticulomyxa filosa]|uniref:Uncharacterized protein n=1 Tax=Reticulomyxa filosa TaxID=46433 RepID=X6NN96_RETFI|nr:hypothetical protein RFI_09680 [Reticulomyxa filosa]|eukprot:ETO27451.1 hypothetical protein RFI_09680 [Reticulomyxa filosa]
MKEKRRPPIRQSWNVLHKPVSPVHHTAIEFNSSSQTATNSIAPLEGTWKPPTTMQGVSERCNSEWIGKTNDSDTFPSSHRDSNATLAIPLINYIERKTEIEQGTKESHIDHKNNIRANTCILSSKHVSTPNTSLNYSFSGEPKLSPQTTPTTITTETTTQTTTMNGGLPMQICPIVVNVNGLPLQKPLSQVQTIESMFQPYLLDSSGVFRPVQLSTTDWERIQLQLQLQQQQQMIAFSQTHWKHFHVTDTTQMHSSIPDQRPQATLLHTNPMLVLGNSNNYGHGIFVNKTIPTMTPLNFESPPTHVSPSSSLSSLANLHSLFSATSNTSYIFYFFFP